MNQRLRPDDLAESYEAGFSIRDLATRRGCSFGTMRSMLLGMGIELRPNTGPKLGIRPQVLTKWIYLLGRGEDEQVIDEMGAILERVEDRRNTNDDSQEGGKDE